MTTIVVQVGTVNAFSASAKAAPAAVSEAATRLGLKLTSQFGETSDPELSRYFVAEAPASVDAETAAEELRRLPEVDAAYVQPEASAPTL